MLDANSPRETPVQGKKPRRGNPAIIAEKSAKLAEKRQKLPYFDQKQAFCNFVAFIRKMYVDLTRFERWNLQSY
jgi:hypothetical protein